MDLPARQDAAHHSVRRSYSDGIGIANFMSRLFQSRSGGRAFAARMTVRAISCSLCRRDRAAD